jgi:hypothetical protein
LTSERIVGAFVFPDFWSDSAQARQTLDSLRQCGLTAIMTESDAYDPAAIDATHAAGLGFYAGVACFSDHASNFSMLHARPELWPILEDGSRRPQLEWYVGMTPTDRRRHKDVLANIGAIARKNPIDGLFLDFVRWPLHWEIELRPGRPRPLDSSFDATSLAKFEETAGVSPEAGLRTTAEKATWIRRHRFREWVDFKCGVVTGFVREARSVLKEARPGARLGIYVVPEMNGLTEPLTGQRIADLAPLVDWVAPMLYHNILLQQPSWVGSALADVVELAGPKALPVVQADSNRDPALAADWGPPMADANWNAVLTEVVSQSGVAGLVVFPGMALPGSRGEALREAIRAWRS